MHKTLQKYLAAFERKVLRIDRKNGGAPHKPILLLSILQAFQEGLITSERIYITPELVALFRANWATLVTTEHDCRFALPFFHLSSSKFWRLVPKQGYENILQLKSPMRSFSNLNTAVEFAEINKELADLMKGKETNNILKQFLQQHYFPTAAENHNTNSDYQEIINNIEDKILLEDPVAYRNEITKLQQQGNLEEIFLRGAIFKREVPKIYQNRCCISGMKVDAIISLSMVDACHIVPFSESKNDTITNGICLCPNLHRAFDRGLIAIDENFQVLVSGKFREDDNRYSIRTFEGETIALPANAQHYPASNNLKWHREYIFVG